MREPQDRSAFLLCALSKVCGPHRGACLPLSPSHSHSACVGDLWRLSPPAGERSSAGGRCETDRGPAPEKSCAHNPNLPAQGWCRALGTAFPSTTSFPMAPYSPPPPLRRCPLPFCPPSSCRNGCSSCWARTAPRHLLPRGVEWRVFDAMCRR